MEAIVQALQTAGVFVVGLLARGGLVLAVLALLALPVMLVAGVLGAVESVRRRQLGLRDVGGLLFRPGLWYAPTHTWLARRPGGSVVVGLDDLAQQEFKTALQLSSAIDDVDGTVAVLLNDSGLKYLSTDLWNGSE